MLRRKVLFFCDAPPELSPSVQVNAVQFRPFFRENGWDVDIMPPASLQTLRWLAIMKGATRCYMRLLLPILRRRQFARKLSSADVVVVHKTITEIGAPPILERELFKRHGGVIFNYDDAVNEIGINYLDQRIALAHAVWVGNEELFNFSLKYNANTSLIRSAVDTDHYRPKDDYSIGSTPVLIWSGTPFSLRYLKMLEKPLSRLARSRKYVLQLICREPYAFSDPNIPCIHYKYNRNLEVALLRQADIALMPLNDGPYERAKENYKVKMYLSCGLPTICSPVGINKLYIRDNENGCFANSSDEWYERICNLLDDPIFRQRLGRTGRRDMVNFYSIPKIGRQLLDLFNQVCAR